MRPPSLVRDLVRDHLLVVFLTCSILVAATMAAGAWIVRRDQDHNLSDSAVGICRAISIPGDEYHPDPLDAARHEFEELTTEGRRLEFLAGARVEVAVGELPSWVGDPEPPRGPGCRTVSAHVENGADHQYRVCGTPCRGTYRLQVVAQDALSQSVVRRSALGVIAALPLAAIVGALTGAARFRARLRPLEDLTRAATRLEATPGVSLGVGARPAELAGLERAFDGLLRRIGKDLAREKRFAQEASHELRTPLTLLRARIEHLSRHLTGRPEERAEAEAALRDVESLDRLVDALLLLARSEEAALPATPVNLCDLAREVAARAGRADGEAGWAPEVMAPDEILVRGSEELLDRAVANLVENARKFAGAQAKVRIRVYRAGSRGVIAVDDDGPGIPPELRPVAFDRFVRGPADRNRVAGVGLGLAVVRAIAERHGGDAATGPGPLGGEEVRISIPLLTPSPVG